MMGGSQELASLQRSYYFSSNDRYDQEQYFMVRSQDNECSKILETSHSSR
jgi:hypothetical protein